MLTLQVLNSDAQLNSFFTATSLQFISGSDTTVVLRIMDNSKFIRYIPDTGATFSIELKNSDGTTVSKTLTNPFADDRSIVSFTITAAESLEIISQNIILNITEGLTTKLAILRNGLSKITTTGSC